MNEDVPATYVEMQGGIKVPVYWQELRSILGEELNEAISTVATEKLIILADRIVAKNNEPDTVPNEKGEPVEVAP